MPWYSIADQRQRCLAFLQSSGPFMLKRFYEGMVGWSKLDGILPVRFEDLTGETTRATRAIESIAAFLGIENCDASRVLSASLASETITKSDGLTRLEDYWSDQAERFFVEIGGAELSARLGAVTAESHSQRATRSKLVA